MLKICYDKWLSWTREETNILNKLLIIDKLYQWSECYFCRITVIQYSVVKYSYNNNYII